MPNKYSDKKYINTHLEKDGVATTSTVAQQQALAPCHSKSQPKKHQKQVAIETIKTTGSNNNSNDSIGGGGGSGESGGGEAVVTCKKNPSMISRWKSRDGERDKVRLRDDDGFRIRAAALVLKETGKETLILLVSGGKDGAKWVVPGGGVEKDEEAEEAAHRELMEEAGVRANTLKSLGIFQDDVKKHRTRVFLMEVAEELSSWEESEYGRQRVWMPLIESAEKVKQSHRSMIEAILAR